MNAARLDQILRQVLVVPVLALLLGAAVLAWQFLEARRTVAQIENSDASIAQQLLVERLIIDQETGLRGFQTTGNSLFLDPYTTAGRQLPQEFARMVAIDGEHRASIDELAQTHDHWEQGFAVPLIATIQAGGKTTDTELNLQGKREMDTMRQRLLSLTRADEQVRVGRIARWQSQGRSMLVALAVSAVALGLLLGFYTRTLLKDVSSAFHNANSILRIRAEEAFRSEQRLRTTLSSIADGVITCDAAGLIQLMNPVAVQLTGWTLGEAAAKPLQEVFRVIDEDTRQPLDDILATIRLNNRPATLSEKAALLRPDGTELQVDDSGAPIRDKRGAIVGFVLVFRDVTMARKSQQALIANEKLAVAGRLAATIAHEIHNPLDSVANLLFLMDGKSTPEESQHFLELAKQEIARVTQISRAMLSLYRESRAPVAIDLKEMLESVLLLLERRFATLGVRVEPELPAGLVVHGFPAELRQVFTNVLTNAAEAASPAAGAEQSVIRLCAEAEPAHLSADGLRREPGVLITVDDDGPGIPEGVQAKLFQPFFTTKGERGTGLGLWVSRGIITKHGGELELTSSVDVEDHGTTVSVFLAENPTIHAGGD